MYTGIFNFVGLWLNIDEGLKNKMYMLNGYNTQLYNYIKTFRIIFDLCFYCRTIYNIGK